MADLDPSFRAGNEVRAEPGYEPSEYYQQSFIESLDSQEGGADEPEAEESGDDGAAQVLEAGS